MSSTHLRLLNVLNGNLAVTLQLLAVVLVAEVVVTCSGETANTPAITPLEVCLSIRA